MSFQSAHHKICILAAFLILTATSGCSIYRWMFGPNEIEDPAIKLAKVEVYKQFGWWFYAETIQPTKGEPGNHGAPLALAFVFTVQNPNKFPVLMDQFKFTVKLDDNKLDDIQMDDKIWIPAQKTNELRVYSLLDVQSARLNVLVEKGVDLKKQKIPLWTAMEEYWAGTIDSGFPVYATDGIAVFNSDKISKTVNFQDAKYIEKPKN